MTQSPLPSLFISHGAPTLAIEDGPAHRFLGDFGKRFGKPQAAIMFSAHFLAPGTTVTASASPETIHDFSGFPDVLHAMQYRAPGSPELASRIVDLLRDAQIQAEMDITRGLDHGAWVPLVLMYPEADVPVVQVSIDPRRGAEFQYRLGQALRSLRAEGFLVIGSGGATHNLRELEWRHSATEAPAWAYSFNEWLADSIHTGKIDDLIAYRERAPFAAKNHPTEEHYFPLLCALGAADTETRRQRVHHSYTYGALSMDTYQFGDFPRNPA